MEQAPHYLICQVAIDTPLRRLFDYRLPASLATARPGSRVRVPFGRRQVVGIIVRRTASSDVPPDKLRDIAALLDAEPLLASCDLALLERAAAYYHHPVGEVFAAALPRLLKAGREAQPGIQVWSLTAAGRAALAAGEPRRAASQRALLGQLAGGEHSSAQLNAGSSAWRAPARALQARGWIESAVRVAESVAATSVNSATGMELTDAQQRAVLTLSAARAQQSFLLDGVTGSGKTEVYLQTAAQVLQAGASVLVLCPEIGLTPQLLQRFNDRFATGIAALHSGLADGERARAWYAAATGRARIVIGTRSAVFTPIPRLGLIIVDEEHDTSYKQQEGGFRYSARDLALLRGQQQQVPVVLGSATPSLESLHNVARGKLWHILLPERAGSATPPKLALLDLRAHAVHRGLAMPLLQTMQRHLAAGSQVLLFLNRRGYAPTLLCQSCGWIAPCRSCDARLTVHQRSNRLACHHCGAEEPCPERCPRCGYGVHPLGHGTERVEETLREYFPDLNIERFDRDVLRQSQQLEAAIERVHSGNARILVGTQMLTKGHHFPDVTLVGVLNADQSLFCTDFRAAERLAQTIVQVAGRAGRADRPGEVLIQSQYPDHPLLKTLLEQGYAGFAAGALADRAAANWPPYQHLALLRASDTTPTEAVRFLRCARELQAPPASVMLQGPVPAAMTRRADRYHAQLLVESTQRSALQQYLRDWVPQLEALTARHSLRWALDVDPLEVF